MICKLGPANLGVRVCLEADAILLLLDHAYWTRRVGVDGPPAAARRALGPHTAAAIAATGTIEVSLETGEATALQRWCRNNADLDTDYGPTMMRAADVLLMALKVAAAVRHHGRGYAMG